MLPDNSASSRIGAGLFGTRKGSSSHWHFLPGQTTPAIDQGNSKDAIPHRPAAVPARYDLASRHPVHRDRSL